MLSGRVQVEKTVWAEFRPGFDVEVRYLTRQKQSALFNDCQRRTWDAGAGRETATLDPAKFRRALAEQVVAGWRGLTAAALREIVLIDDYPDDVPFSAEDCVWLLEQSSEFENWVQTVATHAALYHAERRAAETKNS